MKRIGNHCKILIRSHLTLNLKQVKLRGKIYIYIYGALTKSKNSATTKEILKIPYVWAA